MNEDEIKFARFMFGGDIWQLADLWARGDPDLRDDLNQEGLIALWRLHPDAVFGVSRRWLRRRIAWAMQAFLRQLFLRPEEPRSVRSRLLTAGA